MTPWLSVVGIGEDGLAGLSQAALRLVEDAEILIGGERHLAMVPPDGRERIAWPSPLSVLVERIATLRGHRIAVLATGDPMHFGIGTTLARHVSAAEMTVIPGISAFSLAAARLGWPLDRTAMLTLHGRPIDSLALHVHPGARLLILAHDRTSPAAVAAWLTARGFGASRMAALAHMGGAREARMEGRADGWSEEVPDFHTLAVDCVAGPGAAWHPRSAGLPDDAFRHDGKITKREARALALAKLAPHPGARLWDVGAGCGSIAIEWMRAADRAEAIALEPRADRRALAALNAAHLGVPGLRIVDGAAPEALAGLDEPDAVFLGGGIARETIAAVCRALPSGGRLVAHAVTLESEAELLAARAGHGGDLVRLSVARAEAVGPFTGWRPAMPVTQWAWQKP
ncbi:precorrin-6y C5,15-methyltransferase (decarboxylating) subunit CbiE [Propylenella binzhouense]|uniref:Precorrin-6y C5,15-methyltransferase (Decarboxylating) subunit CbiE n=1 Tax=Propylenella binzhouense TaxID=2555902 RepID=A0A964T4G0_9HYPH|nr:precorrin-6y C5,15-methyltransferase (decarboxylating) subunit CbiE [Propylenella binzhouense]